MGNHETNIILFDGVCNLCNKTVQFIIKRDPKIKFSFASLQSGSGRLLCAQTGLPAGSLDSLIYIRNGTIYTRSKAVLMILRELGNGWNLLYGLIIIPPFLRDGLYDFIARRRYGFFGKSESCMMPVPGYEERFLE